MNIRLAELKDVPQICELYNEFFAYNAKIDPVYCRAGKEFGEYPKSVIEGSDADLIVAEIKSKEFELVGFIHIKEGKTPPYDALMQNHYAQIIDFMVTEQHRRKGVGRKLMDAAKEWAEKRKLDYIELFVLQGAADEQRFYDRSGFDNVMQTKRFML